MGADGDGGDIAVVGDWRQQDLEGGGVGRHGDRRRLG